jgi:hypothetical protein
MNTGKVGWEVKKGHPKTSLDGYIINAIFVGDYSGRKLWEEGRGKGELQHIAYTYTGLHHDETVNGWEK